MRYLAVVLIALASCATAAPPPAPLPRADGVEVRVTLHEGWYGTILCGSRPTGWVRADVMASAEGPQTLAHELHHAAVIEAEGGCAAHEARWKRDPRGVALQMEASAYCVSARVWARQEGVSFLVAAWRFAGRLTAYGFGLTQEEALTAILRNCPSEELWSRP